MLIFNQEKKMNKIEENDYAFYNEPDSKIVVNVPCKVLEVKRVYATVLMFEDERNMNNPELWEVPIEDLQPTDSFYVDRGIPFAGDMLFSAKTNSIISPRQLRLEIKH
tara:strand:+ start:640 stop:963 length:324 start_codon:yes stop_codon:yes gene_type:complete